MLDFEPLRYRGNIYSSIVEQFRAALTPHQVYAMKYEIHDVYTYDAADDGPETEVIRAVRINHGLYILNQEREEYVASH